MLNLAFRYVPRHRDNYVTVDGCKNLNHGFGVSPCRIHQKQWLFETYAPRHRGEADNSGLSL